MKWVLIGWSINDLTDKGQSNNCFYHVNLYYVNGSMNFFQTFECEKYHLQLLLIFLRINFKWFYFLLIEIEILQKIIFLKKNIKINLWQK